MLDYYCKKWPPTASLVYKFKLECWNMGMLEYGNVGMMGNIASGGPRFVVAGRDRARPSKGYLLSISVSHHSDIPVFLKLTPIYSSSAGGALAQN
jgi:hypothetical protein